MISNEIKARVNDKLTECITKATTKYNRSFSMPIVVYRQMGTKAGCAWHIDNKIELNSDFLRNGNLEDMINQTVPHEFAHIVNHIVYEERLSNSLMFRQRRSIHGHTWKSIMRHCFGLDPDRTHDYSLEGVKVKGGKRHLYTCKCGKEFQISTTIHNRILRGQGRRCKACKSGIWLKSGPVPMNIWDNKDIPVNITPPRPVQLNLVADVQKVPMPRVEGEINVPRDWER
jgi:predicted SprT family Zn-dependent metalloprotease